MNSILPLTIKALSTDQELLEKLPHLFSSFDIFALKPQFELNDLDLPFPGIILFTSGSSGQSKAVYFSHQSLRLAAQRSIQFYQLTKDDGIVGALPLYHMGGLLSLLRSLGTGATFEYINPATVQDELGHTTGNVISLVPAQLARCLENASALKRLKEMKVIILGGEAPSKSLLQKALNQRLKISVSYGATETGGQICAHSPGSLLNLESFGFPFDGMKIRPINQQTLVEGPGVADALIINGIVQPLFQQVLLNDHTELNIQDGLHVFGRSDLLFKSGGKFVDPFKITMILKNQFDFNECYLLPLAEETWGNVGVLFYERNNELSTVEKNMMRSMLDRHEVPSHFIKLGPLKNGIKRNKDELYELLRKERLL
ncbi:MAG: hypothetical protein Fur0010_25070 [Bdellovibrio sp.]